ncbi:o-succinylbenzoate synthase [Spirosoma sp. KCTC 42546]|uniref:o-succinylbenzoate synthase n=1 Tax=Spirosoma sp. KCTC 42546 TaxID=2520506 RepID=UPI00115B5736|nr:o-succinylbenzoate synthase [Spirosoma sp. KCTC 42546]QDK80033.1 o-succinylbenzoate synthase [Spirosoma sp. KCTC 42546]
MSLKADFLPYTLHFRFEAGTSRGTLTKKKSYIIRLFDDENPSIVGYGECGPLVGLSYDDRPDFDERLQQYCLEFNELDLQLFSWNIPIVLNQVISPQFPSILFGFETAMLDFLAGGQRIIRASDFTTGQRALPINGLVWMGSPAFMRQQIEEKLQAGYTTLKLKIGALDFEQECDLLAMIRDRFTSDQITLRVDANGAFKPDEALVKLERLATYDLHSIEQPIRAGQPDLLADLCRHTPIPIALDEELIGQMEYVHKFRLLKKIQPQFIILKPTLLGGLRHCDEWIELAGRLNIGWWITSALESNIGLNAIAQYTAQFKHLLPQGLGTGQLYYNNVDSPLFTSNGFLHYDSTKPWNFDPLTVDQSGAELS